MFSVQCVSMHLKDNLHIAAMLWRRILFFHKIRGKKVNDFIKETEMVTKIWHQRMNTLSLG